MVGLLGFYNYRKLCVHENFIGLLENIGALFHDRFYDIVPRSSVFCGITLQIIDFSTL